MEHAPGVAAAGYISVQRLALLSEIGGGETAEWDAVCRAAVVARLSVVLSGSLSSSRVVRVHVFPGWQTFETSRLPLHLIAFIIRVALMSGTDAESVSKIPETASRPASDKRSTLALPIMLSLAPLRQATVPFAFAVVFVAVGLRVKLWLFRGCRVYGLLACMVFSGLAVRTAADSSWRSKRRRGRAHLSKCSASELPRECCNASKGFRCISSAEASKPAIRRQLKVLACVVPPAPAGMKLARSSAAGVGFGAPPAPLLLARPRRRRMVLEGPSECRFSWRRPSFRLKCWKNGVESG